MIAASVVVAVAIAPSAQADPADPSGTSGTGYTPAQEGPYKVGHASPANTKIKFDAKKSPDAEVDVFVTLSGVGSYTAWGGAKAAGAEAQVTAAAVKARAINSTASSVMGTARRNDPSASVLYTATNLIPGVAMHVKASALDLVASRKDVVKVQRLVPKTTSNSNAAQLTRVLNTWQSTGLLGNGVKIGVIDTGIDYTHADFGGAGTIAAYNKASTTASGAWKPDPKTNVVGGYDFAGDAYDAGTAANNIPKPDPNPLDCEGHGTHVSGTTGGKGVNADGSTYTGKYSDFTSSTLNAMRIGPGMAPKASLYALKVFGCAGSTNLTQEALNWAMDPNGDHNFSDKLDIVNLSLGSDFATEDDPDNAAVDALAAAGVLPVIAMGNGGDVTDVGGAPGSGVRSLAVASSVDSFSVQDGVKATAPASVAGTYAGQQSVAYQWATAPPVSGSVVAIPGSNADGCDALSATDAAKVRGKIAWLEWSDVDSARRCGSVARSGNVQQAGAIGAIFTSQLNNFSAGITGSTVIPVFQITAAATNKLRPAMTAGTLAMTFDGSLRGAIKKYDNSITDTLSDFSSRGPHGLRGVVKPDVTAPGATITSAGFGTGSLPATESGTSMATPHTAGIAALVKQLHPTWTPEQIKADIMNTAGHDVFTGVNKTGLKYGPNRVGAGRIDALAAVNNEVLAYSADRGGAVTMSFGVTNPDISGGIVTKSQRLRIQNTAGVGRTVSVGYEAINTNPGITYSVSNPNVYLGAKASVIVTVFMKIDPTKLTHKIDPTMAVTQVNAYTGLSEPRQFESDASGRLIVRDSTSKMALRVPVFGIAKAASTTKAAKGTLGGAPAITLTGKGANGANKTLVSVLTYGASSGLLPVCKAAFDGGCVTISSERAADIRTVGAGSAKGASGKYSDGFLWFGIATASPWATIGHSVVPYVNIYLTGDDRSGDGSYTVFGLPSPVGATGQNDVLMAALQNNRTKKLVSIMPVNYSYGDVDTNTFDTNTIILPVDPAAIGVKSTNVNYGISYRAGTYNANSGLVYDEVAVPFFNVTQPALTTKAPIYSDQGGTAIAYTLGVRAPVGTKALVMHLNGQPTRRTDVVTVK